MRSPRSLLLSQAAFQESESTSWQYRWKRPQLVFSGQVDRSSESSTNYYLIHHSSASVAPHELEHTIPKEELPDPSDVSLVVSVTLLSTRSPKGPANVVRIQLEQLPNHYTPRPKNEAEEENQSPVSSVLISRDFQWPESILSAAQSTIPEEEDSDDDNQADEQHETMSFISSIFRGRPQRVRRKGLVSATLLRQSGPERDTALEVLQLLSMGGLAHTEPATNTSTVETRHTGTKNLDGDLHLACLSRDGVVHIYSAVQLLEHVRVDTQENNVEYLLMGELLSRVQSSVRPLSTPMTTVSLSVAMGGSSDRSNETDKPDPKEAKPSTEHSFWEASTWDSTVDKASLPFSTRKNSVRLCVSAWNFLIVAGSGYRSPSVKRDGDQQMKRTPSTNSMQSALSQASSMDTVNTVSGTDVGGFVTFLSTRPYSEVKTVYIPFAPLAVSPLRQNGEYFVLVTGEGRMAAIFLDKETSHVGDLRPLEESLHDTIPQIRPFRVLPISLPRFNDVVPTIFGSGGDSFPTMDLAFTEADRITLVRRSFTGVQELDRTTDEGTLLQDWADYDSEKEALPVMITDHSPNHEVATIEMEEEVEPSLLWCQSGPGFSLLGAGGKIFFVCWEGTTSVHQIGLDDWNASVACNVLSLGNIESRTMLELGLGSDTANSRWAGQQQDGMPSLTRGDLDGPSGPEDFVTLDNVLKQIERGSSTSNLDDVERAIDIQRFCSSWRLLDGLSKDAHIFDPQSSRTSICLRSLNSVRSISLTLRRSSYPTSTSSRLQNVIAWLVSKDDYFTASSITLALLEDQATLTYMWRRFGLIASHSSLLELDHVTDGLEDVSDHRDVASLKLLADISIVCMIRAGCAMSSTLHKFLARNEHYDLDACSLLLAATIVSTLSDDSEAVAVGLGKLYCPTEPSVDDRLWPIECLIKACSSRDRIETQVAVLNAAIPEQLRNRNLGSQENSQELFGSLIRRLVASDDRVVDLLLSLVDSKSGVSYWDSIDRETKLKLALMKVQQSHPFLLHHKVRSWICTQLHDCLQQDRRKSNEESQSSFLPSSWIADCITACMLNAKCGVYENMDLSTGSPLDGFEAYKRRIQSTRNMFIAQAGTDGVDFRMIISSLLVLETRHYKWGNNQSLSTSDMLHAACYMAGRKTDVESAFGLDTKTIMEECTIANNVRAGANLVGGRNGLILDCCDIVMEHGSIDMDAAQDLILSEDVDDDITVVVDAQTFEVGESHYRVLSHFEDYALSARTYGRFSARQSRGQVHPVFATEACFRTLWYIFGSNVTDGSLWLESWLREKLDLSEKGGTSPLRLACAALTRTLIWPGKRSGMKHLQKEKTLADRLQFSQLFLVQLAQSCCGLAEAVPDDISQEMAEQSQEHYSNSPARIISVPAGTDASVEESFISAISSFPTSP